MSSAAVAMPISQSKVRLDACTNMTTGAQRPISLLLDSVSCKDSELMIGGTNMANIGDARRQRKKKKCRAADARVKKFADVYESTGESLGEGSFGHVRTYRNVVTNKEYAVKVIEKSETKSRHRVLKEIEIFHHCQGHENILQLIEYFEEDYRFYLVFEKMEGGTLLDCILRRGHLTEQEASLVVRDIASGLNFLHKKGIAHRDLKPENILCVKAGQLTPVKICDFDLGSGIQIGSRHCSPVTTPELLSPVGSADFMAPEVVDVWQYQAWSYDKRCDLWSLGTILYILLCGYRPFYAHCGRDCGFEEGRACEDCQELLFKCIQQGVYTFPQPDWDDISHDAKDLIQHLLVKNPYQRYTAEQVLRHPWLSKESSGAALSTPYILSRNNSVRELGMFAETANAVNRLIQRHLSINEVCAITTPAESENRLIVEEDNVKVSEDSCNSNVALPSSDESKMSFGIFQLSFLQEEDADDGIGRWSEEDDEERPELGKWSEEEVDDASSLKKWRNESQLENDGFPMWVGLSPPGESRLAKRRTFRMKHESLSEISIDSGTASNSSSPPDKFSSLG
jgi:MAP kinase interacting serine/threonine kinase